MYWLKKAAEQGYVPTQQALEAQANSSSADCGLKDYFPVCNNLSVT